MKPAVAMFAAAGACVGSALASDWPQLQHDPERTGYTNEPLQPPFRVAWTRNFQPERVERFVQPIIHRGKVFIGTKSGHLYCLDAASGEDVWEFACGSPIVHTAACSEGKVCFAALNGCVYALNADSGDFVWRFEGRKGYGISAAPLILGNALYIGGRDGTFYGISLDDGKLRWEHEAGAPIFNTAAGHDGTVYFGAEDMRLRALSTDSGQLLWTSDELCGQSMKGTHPVVCGDIVIIRPMMNHLSRKFAWEPDFTPCWDKDVFERRYQEALENGVRKGEMPDHLLKLQDEVEAWYRDHPREQDLFMLDVATGRKLPVVPHFRVNSMHGPVCPPALDPDGLLIIPWTYVNHGWARLDLDQRRAVELIVPPRPTNADETLNVSVARDYVFIFHCQEGNANYTGIYDLAAKEWVDFERPGGRWGELADNIQSGSHAVSIADGRFYHIVFHQLAAWDGRRGKEAQE